MGGDATGGSAPEPRTTDHLGLTRYRADGSIDQSFDYDGKVMTGVSSTERAWDVTSDGSDVIAVGESSGPLGGADFCIIRHDANGSQGALPRS